MALYTVTQKKCPILVLIFYKFKKPELIFISFISLLYMSKRNFLYALRNSLIILASKSIYNFASHLAITYFNLHFFSVGKMSYFHTSVLLVNMPFNKKTAFLLKFISA